MVFWNTWQDYKNAQYEVELPANTAAHIPVKIRFVDVGTDQTGTILLMHGIPSVPFTPSGASSSVPRSRN